MLQVTESTPRGMMRAYNFLVVDPHHWTTVTSHEARLARSRWGSSLEMLQYLNNIMPDSDLKVIFGVQSIVEKLPYFATTRCTDFFAIANGTTKCDSHAVDRVYLDSLLTRRP